MKKIMTLLTLIVATYSGIAAQITVTNSVFPAEGDTLRVYYDSDISSIDLLSPGENLFWNFSSFNTDTEQDVVFLAASEGSAASDFPDADLVALFDDIGSERYLNVTSDYVAEVGFAGLDPILRMLRLSTIYDEEYIIQKAPLNYGDVHRDTALLRSKFLFDSLPQEIKDQLGAFRADSIRVDVAVTRNDEVDAWGQVEIPGGIYNVLRNRSVEMRNTSVFAYTSFFGWANVTQTIQGLLDDPSVLEPVELTIYTFLSNNSKEPIAAVTLDSLGMPGQVQFKRTDVTSTSDQWRYASVKMTPNPTYGKVKLYYSGLTRGEYELVIHDILGKILKRIRLTLDENGIEKMDHSDLSKGTYLYSLKTDKGETITTKRLVVIRP